MSRLLAILIVGFAALGVGHGVPARADDAAESRFFDRVGRRAFAQRRYERALESFLRAQRAAPSPRGLYNVAVCARLAHRDALAFTSFEQLLARGDLDAALRAEAVAQRDSLAGTLALVRVESDPPGATIYVDRRDLGAYGTTPTTLALPPGAHQIELVRADHEGASMTVEASVGQSRQVRAELPRHVGRVRVDVSPPSATIVAQREGTELTLSSGVVTPLPVGSYTIVGAAEGFLPASATVTVLADAEATRVLTLSPIPTPRGRLLVSTGAVAARVSIDGVVVSETPARVAGVTVGTHRVTVSAEGFREWSQDVDVREARTTFLSITLVRAEPGI
ncbi:MAG: PEGA domain-containing protein [Deltaproteobacteria bacterium]|nr:PEGA domain-containing protein [Deltaproteobacteria bacterium]